MPDPVVPPTPEVPATEPSLMDIARTDVSKLDDGSGTAPSTTETPASIATVAEKEAAVAEAAPGLTDEQIKALAEDPKIVEAVFGSQTGGKELDTIFREMLTPAIAAHDTEVATKAVQQKEIATIEEALKTAQDDGDFAPIGKLMVEKISAQKQAVAASEGVEVLRGDVTKEVIGHLDTAVEKVYGDVLDKMSDEELAALSRANFPDDASFYAGVLGAFDTKRQELVRSQAGIEVGAELTSTAAATAAAAAKARGLVGVGALPGGKAEEGALGDDVSLLLRQGMAGAFSDESD
jgi:hypothetical protein